ncbi:hypothetical protein Cni_G11456 [Canna indica]|uniref:Uncharacterized protein n=1 Tax=Canna indica TaxID=4628 RepID=A0AAQ3K665_9LILI|nr:hypothetical protein Cni_G11456 [Canna indica]
MTWVESVGYVFCRRYKPFLFFSLSSKLTTVMLLWITSVMADYLNNELEYVLGDHFDLGHFDYFDDVFWGDEQDGNDTDFDNAEDVVR